MARKQRSSKQSKKLYYFVVEGCTEENYIKLLKILFRKDAVIENCNGGSAKNVMKKAKKVVDKNNDEYLGYIIWFDNDTYKSSIDSDLKNSLDTKQNTAIYISKPCIENWLLAHFQTININEHECDACEKKLKTHIPNYEKNDCGLLTKYIDETKIKTAIANYPEIGKIPQNYFGFGV